eukprot:scaffold97336_cov59-Attheya_sp.AAC.1
MKIVKENFPFPVPNPISSVPHPSTRSTSNPSPVSMPPPLTDTQPYLRHTKRGKAGGPCADIIDIPRA